MGGLTLDKSTQQYYTPEVKSCEDLVCVDMEGRILYEDFFFLWYGVKRQLLFEHGIDEGREKSNEGLL